MRALYQNEIPADGWKDHRMGPCPVGEGVMVYIRYRIGLVYGPLLATARRWAKFKDQTGPLDFDIVGWRLA